MASALLVSLVLMAGDPPAPAGTLACNPPDGPLAEQVCLSERLLDRDRRVAEGLIALSRTSLPEAALAGIGRGQPPAHPPRRVPAARHAAGRARGLPDLRL